VDFLTLFTWGYWGWGTATDQLIQAVDTVETSRGYQPPMFVDIRISRSVRAPGFNGRAFEKAVGASRYRWLDALGNLAVRDGGSMRIKDPAAAATLLDIAEKSGRIGQRILFFCSCEFPGIEGHGCHRTTVAGLVLEAAGTRQLPVQVVEWPGGEPRLDNFELQLSGTAFDKVARGATSILLDKPVLAEMAAVPWLSLVTIREKGNQEEPPFRLLTGPARCKKGEWYLPIYEDIGTDMPDEQIPQHVQELRKRSGFASRHTQP
jgi:hypothetical protein